MENQRVEALSKRLVQAYAWGDVVWHVWGLPTTGRSLIQAGNANGHGDTTQATKPPLVLLHGGSGSWLHWVRNVEHFSQTRSVWVLDIPGFGDSSLPDGVTDADGFCLLYTSPSPRDLSTSRMPSSA